MIGTLGAVADVTREEIAGAGGTPLAEILTNPTRQEASPVMTRGASELLRKHLVEDAVHAVIGLGGTQGTSNCTRIMQTLPYGFPKVMVSTVASGDTSAFVDIKDITMMFSVGDILGLNPDVSLMEAVNALRSKIGCGVMVNVNTSESNGRTYKNANIVSELVGSGEDDAPVEEAPQVEDGDEPVDPAAT